MIRKTQNCIFIFYTIPIKLLPWIILIIAKQILKKEEFCVKIDIKISELTGRNRKYFHEADEEFQDFMSICDFSYIHVQLLLILCKTKNYRMNDESWLLKKSFNGLFPTSDSDESLPSLEFLRWKWIRCNVTDRYIGTQRG